MSDYYQVMSLSRSATSNEIRNRYKLLAKLHHPDQGGNSDRMAEINAAYEVLYSPSKRHYYNQSLKDKTRVSSTPYANSAGNRQPNNIRRSPDTHSTSVKEKQKSYFGRAIAGLSMLLLVSSFIGYRLLLSSGESLVISSHPTASSPSNISTVPSSSTEPTQVTSPDTTTYPSSDSSSLAPTNVSETHSYHTPQDNSELTSPISTDPTIN